MKLLHGLAFLLPVTAALCACGGGDAPASPQGPLVEVAPVAIRKVTQWDDFTGRVVAKETVALRPRVTGYIERINYDEGQEVKEGDVLFTIDARSYEAQLHRQEAELARARTQADLARSEALRAERLASQNAIAAEELDQRRSAQAQAGASVRAAESALAVARLDVDYTRVRSPISGRAGRASVTRGNLARADDTVLTSIVSLDPVQVYFEADEQTYLRYAGSVRSGEGPNYRTAQTPVRVGLAGEDGYPHAGVMDFVDNQVDPATGTLRGRAELPNPDRLLLPGLFARVQLVGGGEFPAMLIDGKAIRTDQDRKYVWVVDAEGKAQRKDVQLGRIIDGLTVVRAGLAEGDRVVVAGMQKIFAPGMPVQPVEVAMDRDKAAPAPAAEAPAAAE